MSDNVEIRSGKDRADENFPVGSLLIRPDLRAHVHAYYRFARTADDIGDSETLTPEDKIARLDVMEAVLLGSRETGSPSALALRATLAATKLDPTVATDLLRAFRQDALKQRYADWPELLEYCRYSAAPVGRLLLGLHGEAAETLPPSDALCASLQVLNHLQDCKDDLASLDRCYLPLDMMKIAGARVVELRLHKSQPEVRAWLDFVLDEVEELNELARTLPGLVRDRRMRLESAIVVNLALRLTQRLRRQDPLAGRVKLTKPDVFFAVLAALRYLP